MIETYLFVVVGAVAVVAAFMMLLSENAVHSALFLILNFVCVAFMYLMLDAPFLAMVQIAVYAGAIMVLFLFVIMLLGAEQAESRLSEMRSMPGYRWHTRVALVLALVLMLSVGVAISQGGLANIQPTETPRLRVVHYANAATNVNVELNGVVVAEDLVYRDQTGVFSLDAGEHELVVTDFESGSVLYEDTITLETAENTATLTTAVLFGGDDVTLTTFVEDLTAPADRAVRVVVYNAFTDPVSLQDTGILQMEGDVEVLVSNLEPGAVSEPFYLEPGEIDALRFVRPEDETEDRGSDINPLYNIRERELDPDSSTLIVLKPLPDSIFPDIGFTTISTPALFGSPKAVGQLLFTRYLLPFEVVSLVLLSSLVGVIIIAQRQVAPDAVRQSAARHRARRRVSRPLASVITSQVSGEPTDNPRLTSGDDSGAQPAGD